MTNLSNLSGGRLPTNRIAASSYNPIAAATSSFPTSYPIGTPVVVPPGPGGPPGSVVPGDGHQEATADVVGLCAETAVVGDPTIVQTIGTIHLTTEQWDQVVVGEVGGLLQGLSYYLSTTVPGKLTSVRPVDVPGVVKRVGIALSPTDFLIDRSLTPVPAS